MSTEPLTHTTPSGNVWHWVAWPGAWFRPADKRDAPMSIAFDMTAALDDYDAAHPLVVEEVPAPEMSDTDLVEEVRRRLARTDITDAQLVSELRRRIGHLDREECYDVIAMVGAAEEDSMLAYEVCDAVEFLFKLARGAT